MIWLLMYFILVFVSYRWFNEKKELSYRNWYRPLLLILLILLSFFAVSPVQSVWETILPLQIQKMPEILFCWSVVILWIALKYFLRKFKVNDKMEELLRKINTNDVMRTRFGFANYLVWPYEIDEFTIRYKPGILFFQLFTVILFVLVAGVFLLMSNFEPLYDRISVYPLLIIPVLSELILYFYCPAAEPPREKIEDEIIEPEIQSDYYHLYKRYINKKMGFYQSLIFASAKSNEAKGRGNPKEARKMNDEALMKSVDDLLKQKINFIVAEYDFFNVLPNLAPAILHVLKSGGNILMIADISDYTKSLPESVGISYESQAALPVTKLFAILLQQNLEYYIPTAKDLLEIEYFSSQKKDGLKKRIVLCNLEDASSDSLLNSKWAGQLDLKIIFQIDDCYINNLGQKRNFSLRLDQLKKEHLSIFFKEYTAGGDEALSNTFINTRDVPEDVMPNPETAVTSYFINFALEKSHSNLNQLLTGNPGEFHLAPGTELSVFPIMENISHIHFFEGMNAGYVQSANKLTSLTQSFLSNPQEKEYDYAGKVTSIAIKESIKIDNLPFSVKMPGTVYCADEHLSIVFDRYNNAPKIYKKYRHLGKEVSFICVVSRPHIFREYFAENMDYFSAVTLEPLEPDLSDSKINLCLELFSLLTRGDMEVDRIIRHLSAFSIDLKKKSLTEFINGLFKQYLYFDALKTASLKAEEKIVFKDGAYKKYYTLTLNRQNKRIQRIFDDLKRVEVRDGTGNLLLKLPKYLLFQNFLPEQNINIWGLSYTYQNFNPGTKELTLNISETVNVFYKPYIRIKVSNGKVFQVSKKHTETHHWKGKDYENSTQILERTLRIESPKYYTFDADYHSPNAPGGAKTVDCDSLEFLEISGREYTTRYLEVKWEVHRDYYEQIPYLTTRMHQLLYEMLTILFPLRNQYIHIASNNQFEKEHRVLTPWIFAENNFEYDKPDGERKHIEIFIIEDSFSDMGVLKPIETFFGKTILPNLYHYLKWLTDKDFCEPEGYTEFLMGPSLYDKSAFLRYGLTAKETAWNFPLLITFLENSRLIDPEKIGKGYKKNCSQDHQRSMTVECDYCRTEKLLSEVEVMEDGLHRCRNCSKGAVDDLHSARELEKKAKRLFKQHLGIDFGEMHYDFRFVTATELHRYYKKEFHVTNKYDERVAVGLASEREIDMIHVEKFYNRPYTLSIIIHELMHIYQYQKLNFLKMKNTEKNLIEGMTTYTEWFLLEKSEDEKDRILAGQLWEEYINADSEYGEGFRHVKKDYGEDFLKKISAKYSLRP